MELRQFRQPYYFINFILALTYLILRVINAFLTLETRDQYSIFKDDGRGAMFSSSEQRVIMFISIALVFKAKKALTLSEYVGTVMMYAKIANIIMFAQNTKQPFLLASIYRVRGFDSGRGTNPSMYACIVLSVYFLFPERAVDPASTQMIRCSLSQFLSEYKSIDLKNERRSQPWTLAFFTANWSRNCANFWPIFNQLANKYGDRIRFLCVDVGVAGRNSDRDILKNEFEIDTNTLVEHIPALLLLDIDSKIRGRIVYKEKYISKNYVLSERNVTSDLHLIDVYRQAKPLFSRKN
ncbi:hypothetical protein ACOME3_003615 [Neoechinorhynchus agilis]